jgi:hypothetical protein
MMVKACFLSSFLAFNFEEPRSKSPPGPGAERIQAAQCH